MIPRQPQHSPSLRRARRQVAPSPPSPPRVEPFRPDMLYLCQLCGNVARYPREKRHTFHLPFGRTWTVTYVTPMVCIECRLGHQPEAKHLNDGRRRFWQRFFAIYLGERYPSMGPWMNRIVDWRLRYQDRKKRPHA